MEREEEEEEEEEERRGPDVEDEGKRDSKVSFL